MNKLYSGFPSIDKIVGGFRKSDLIVIGSRPGKGKTTFAEQIVLNVAMGNQIPTMVFSTAQSATSYARNLLLIECGRTRTWIEEYPDMFDEVARAAVAKLSRGPLFIDDTPELEIVDFLCKVNKVVKEEGVRLIVIDCFQFMRDSKSFPACGQHEEEMACIAESLKKAAEELRVPIIVLSPIQRGTDRPQMDDLLDSKELIELADVVILMHNGIWMGEIEVPISGEFIIAKNTHGSIGTAELTCDLNQGKFYEKGTNDYIAVSLK